MMFNFGDGTARIAYINDDHIIRIDNNKVIARRIDRFTKPVLGDFKRMLEEKLERVEL